MILSLPIAKIWRGIGILMSGVSIWFIISATSFQSIETDLSTYYQVDSPAWKVVNDGLVKVWLPDMILPVPQFTGQRLSPGSFYAKYQDASGDFSIYIEHLQTEVTTDDLPLVQQKMVRNLRAKRGIEVIEQRMVTQHDIPKIYLRLRKPDLLGATYTELSISTIQGRLFVLSCSYPAHKADQWKTTALKVLSSWKEV
ncbi:MAG: hypothetical protein AAFP89_16230 [Bacteroidota bacterium]